MSAIIQVACRLYSELLKFHSSLCLVGCASHHRQSITTISESCNAMTHLARPNARQSSPPTPASESTQPGQSATRPLLSSERFHFSRLSLNSTSVPTSGPAGGVFRWSSPSRAGPGSDAFRSAAGYVRLRLTSP